MIIINIKILCTRVTSLHHPSRVKPRVLAWCAQENSVDTRPSMSSENLSESHADQAAAVEEHVALPFQLTLQQRKVMIVINIKSLCTRVTSLHHPSRVKPRVLAWCAQENLVDTYEH